MADTSVAGPRRGDATPAALGLSLALLAGAALVLAGLVAVAVLGLAFFTARSQVQTLSGPMGIVNTAPAMPAQTPSVMAAPQAVPALPPGAVLLPPATQPGAMLLPLATETGAMLLPPATQPGANVIVVPGPNAIPPATQPAAAAPVAHAYIVPAGRSPLPQPGEAFTRPIPARRLDGAGPAPAATAPTTTAPASASTIKPEDASKHLGETVTVEGKIVDTYNTGSVCFLNFSRDRTGTLYGVIFRGLLNAWPQAPEAYFLDKTVRLTGKVEMHKDRPQVRIEKKEQIVVVE